MANVEIVGATQWRAVAVVGIVSEIGVDRRAEASTDVPSPLKASARPDEATGDVAGRANAPSTVSAGGTAGGATPTSALSAARRIRVRACLGVGGAVAVLALIPMANIWNPSFPFDDAYISFAYALHLASGHGLVLNAGTPPVEAFSNPLWVFVLALGRLFSIPVPTWSLIVNAVLIGCLAGCTMGLVGWLAPRSPAWIGALAGVFVAFVPATAFAADGGLETILFAVLFTAFAIGVVRDSASRRSLSWFTVSLGVLLTLTRPEGSVALAAAWATSWVWQRDVRRQVHAALGFVVPGLVIEAARVLYFHELLPNSVVAKEGTTAAQMLSSAGLEVAHFWRQYVIVIVVALVTMVAAVVRRRDMPNVWPIVPVTLALGAFEVAVSVGDNYPYERYLYSLLPVFAAFAASGIALIGWPTAHRQRRHRRRSNRPKRISVAVVVVAICTGSVTLAYANREIPWATVRYLNVPRGVGRIGDIVRADHLQQHGEIYNYALAAWLRDHQQHRPLIALDEIGIVSYYTDAKVIDLIGLANRHIARLPGTMGSRADPEYVFGRRPEDIVFLAGGCICSGLHDDSVYASDRWMLGYHLTNVFYDGTRVTALLFQRTPGLLSVETLGSQLPPRQVTRRPLPSQIMQLLDKATVPAPATADLIADTLLAAGGSLAVRSTVTMTDPGTSVTVHLGKLSGQCAVTATAITLGGDARSPLEATVVGRDGAVLASRTVTPGVADSLTAVTLRVGAGWEGAALRLTSPKGASWVEPYVACT